MAVPKVSPSVKKVDKQLLSSSDEEENVPVPKGKGNGTGNHSKDVKRLRSPTSDVFETATKRKRRRVSRLPSSSESEDDTGHLSESFDLNSSGSSNFTVASSSSSSGSSGSTGSSSCSSGSSGSTGFSSSSSGSSGDIKSSGSSSSSSAVSNCKKFNKSDSRDTLTSSDAESVISLELDKSTLALHSSFDLGAAYQEDFDEILSKALCAPNGSGMAEAMDKAIEELHKQGV